MKNLAVLTVLIILASPAVAQESVTTVTIGDFDSTLQGFSFSRGELIKVSEAAEGLPVEIDFVLDLPNGLGMNNGDLSPWFLGGATIADLGVTPIESKAELNIDEFTLFLLPEKIIPGHTYHIQPSDSSHYGRIHVVDFDAERGLLTFSWTYLKKLNTEQ